MVLIYAGTFYGYLVDRNGSQMDYFGGGPKGGKGENFLHNLLPHCLNPPKQECRTGGLLWWLPPYFTVRETRWARVPFMEVRMGVWGASHPQIFSHESWSKVSHAARELATVFSLTIFLLVTIVGQFGQKSPPQQKVSRHITGACSFNCVFETLYQGLL